jgi:hypothetical protein
VNTSPHIHSALAADISARRIAAGAGAVTVRRRRRAPLAVLAARLRPAAGRRAAQPAS